MNSLVSKLEMKQTQLVMESFKQTKVIALKIFFWKYSEKSEKGSIPVFPYCSAFIYY